MFALALIPVLMIVSLFGVLTFALSEQNHSAHLAEVTELS